jgi:molybdopterin/thiamine biosynthesis adenylyltransferase
MARIDQWLAAKTCNGLLSWVDQAAAAKQFNTSVATIEGLALKQGILPARYQRNRNLLSCEDQYRLFCSHVVIIGCGGLGGHVIEGLARLGVGHLTIIDPDVFEEHNLNRQTFCTIGNLGRNKAEVIAEQLAELNPAVTISSHVLAFASNNGNKLLADADIVVDALDSITVRLELSAVCRQLRLPLVHGAIGGWSGQVTSQLTGDNSLETLYVGKENHTGIEDKMGNPSFTPALVAALQVTETTKILLNIGEPLSCRLLTIDLLDMEFVEIQI